MLAEHLTRLRSRAGMTVPQASKATGIPLSTLYAYEQGRIRPGPDRLRQLCGAYGASALDKLLAFELYTDPNGHSEAACA